jgi:hypothetical protein
MSIHDYLNHSRPAQHQMTEKKISRGGCALNNRPREKKRK